MKRVLLLCSLFLTVAATTHAEPVALPKLITNLEKSVVVPGQIISLDVTILVPTWMPAPPTFPALELQDVSIRLDSGSSGPAMQRIGADTWSGVTRSYQISPLVVGGFRIPPQTVTVTYADPETRTPIVAELEMNEVVFEGVAPAGAEDLDPFMAASTLTLDEQIDGDPQSLEPGSAFTRTVTARLTGASPIFLPPLIPLIEGEGLAAYPKEPVINESSNRGITTGERRESVTYVAEAGGRLDTSPIRLRWWNLRTEEIEVAELPALEIISRGPPPRASSPFDPRGFASWLVVSVLGIVVLGMAARWQWPRFVEYRRRRLDERLESETFAFERVFEALRSHRFGDALRAVEVWATRLPLESEPDRERLFAPLEPLSALLYGCDGRAPSKAQWSTALDALREARRHCLSKSRIKQRRRVLPPLNPARTPSRSG